MRHLAAAWLRTAAGVAASGDVAGAGADLLVRWAQPHRRYHGLAHLDAVLRRVDELATTDTKVVGVDLEVVRLGAWFHDAVYDVTADDNEVRSALLAEKVLMSLRVPAVHVAEVVRLVAMTASHDPAEGDRSGALLCDADLAVLASDPAAYTAYTEAVRSEYAHLDNQTFARGRRDVLRSLQDRPVLFRTAYGRRMWEARARKNLATELAAL